jgi:hypothetical protein
LTGRRGAIYPPFGILCRAKELFGRHAAAEKAAMTVFFLRATMPLGRMPAEFSRWMDKTCDLDRPPSRRYESYSELAWLNRGGQKQGCKARSLMTPDKKFRRTSSRSAGARHRKEPGMTIDTSFVQILAAADIRDEDDVALRAALFATLRDLGAEYALETGPDGRSSYPRYPHRRCRGAASGATSLTRGVRRSPRSFVQ